MCGRLRFVTFGVTKCETPTICFPLHRTHTVISDWMPLSFAKLEFVIL